jgi:alanyl-tRNA synthetase
VTERLYHKQADLLEFEARLTRVGQDGERHFAILDRTAFYPTSGGQSHDTGLLGSVLVEDVVVDSDGEIRHYTSQPVGKPDDLVVGKIDRARRTRHSQQHTAQHILSQAMARLFDYETVSVHLGEKYGAVELNTATLSSEESRAAEDLSNEIIAANRPVEISFFDQQAIKNVPLRKPPPTTGMVRVITIPDFECNACGGTHTATTGGVGLIKLIGQELLRGHALVKFLCGDLARSDYAARFQITDELAQSLTCHFTDLPIVVRQLVSDSQTLRRQVSALYEELLPVRVEALVSQTGGTLVSEKAVASVASLPDQRLAARLATMLGERTARVAMILTDGRLHIAVPKDIPADAGALAKMLASKTTMNGGGNPSLAQLGGAEAERLEQYHNMVTEMLNAQ